MHTLTHFNSSLKQTAGKISYKSGQHFMTPVGRTLGIASRHIKAQNSTTRKLKRRLPQKNPLFKNLLNK